MREHSIEFMSPGTFYSETSTCKVPEWDPRLAVRKAMKITERYNATPYGFRFLTHLTQPDVPDGEGGFLKVEPKEIASSGTYFLGGTIETYEEICERNLDDERNLRSNMLCNDYPLVVVNTNSWKSTLPFTEKDKLLDADGNVAIDGNAKGWREYRTEFARMKKIGKGIYK